MTKVLMIGYGNMGQALAQGMKQAGIADELLAIDPGAPSSPDLFDSYSTLCDHKGESWRPDWLVIAIKPQKMQEVAPAYRPLIEKGCRVLSIVAGWSLAHYADLYGTKAQVIRAMPNTPAALGKGTTVLVANDQANAATKTQAQALMETCGLALWLDHESQIDAVCAISGSGPAYVFLLTQALAQTARDAGVSPQDADRLARQTVIGSGALLEASTQSPQELRRRVTSPGGVTAAAVEVLNEQDAWQKLISAAIAAGEKRARELG